MNTNQYSALAMKKTLKCYEENLETLHGIEEDNFSFKKQPLSVKPLQEPEH